MYYLQSRYYNPEWDRFVNADAIIGQTGELLGHNLFAYCMNDPIDNFDPAGFRMLSNSFEEVEFKTVVIAVIVTAFNVTRKVIGNAISSTVNSTISSIRMLAKSNNKSKLPNQGAVEGNVPGAPPVDAGSQKKHVPGHPGSIPGKSQWPEGEDGVELTQEGWMNGRTVKKQPGEEVRIWDTGKVIGPNGETKVKVHMKEKTGMIHGYPVQ